MKHLIHWAFGWRWPTLARFRWYRQWQGIPEPMSPEWEAIFREVGRIAVQAYERKGKL